jgi:hypothetical protein
MGDGGSRWRENMMLEAYRRLLKIRILSACRVNRL